MDATKKKHFTQGSSTSEQIISINTQHDETKQKKNSRESKKTIQIQWICK